MPVSVSSLKKVLADIEDELRRMPAFLMESGKAVDDPEYGRQTSRLEALQARLSLAIKELQNRPNPSGPEASQALKYARDIQRKIRAAEVRAQEQNPQELFAEALGQINEFHDHIHEYHAMLEVPGHHPAYVPLKEQGESLEGILVMVFAVLAHFVQKRRHDKG